MAEQHIDIERSAGTLALTHRWRGAVTYFLLLFGVVWTIASVTFLLTDAWPAALLFLFIGGVVDYFALASFLNKTVITVDSRKLSVTHGPLPTLSRDRELRSQDLEQCYLTQGGSQTTNGETTQHYNLMARPREGKHFMLAGSLTKETGRELEHAIEAFLNIEDEAIVAGPPNILDLVDREKLPTFVRRGLENMEARARAQPQKAVEHVHQPVARERAAEPAYDEDTVVAYRAAPGTSLRIQGQSYVVVANRHLSWDDPDSEAAHELALEGPAGRRRFYAEIHHGRWRYFEERELSVAERATLGFEPERDRPVSLRNGKERYFPNNPQRGSTGRGRATEQHVYYAGTDSARFRAIRTQGQDWRVFVQESFDDDYFERPGAD